MGHGKSPTQCEDATGVSRDGATGVLHNALMARRETAWEVFVRRSLAAAGRAEEVLSGFGAALPPERFTNKMKLLDIHITSKNFQGAQA
ncbi:MAG TPA: hypothetical protein VGM09_16450 [Bradyrhizobium sp.]|jgi:hypothetical protein